MAIRNKDNKKEETEKRKLFKKKINRFLNENFKWFIVFVVSVIFILGTVNLLIPQYRETIKIAEIITTQGQVDVEAKQKELEDIKNFLVFYNKIDKRYIEKVDSIIPEKYNKEELFTEFNHIIENNGLLLQSIAISDAGIHSVSNNRLTKDLKKINIIISVGGTDYKAFKNLLYSLENNLKLMDITNIDFSPDGLSTKLVITTYCLN